MRAVAWLVALLPYGWLRGLGAALGLVAGSVLRIRRRQVEGAIEQAGIGRPARVARGVYASLGAGLLELLWLAGRPADALDGLFSVAPEAAAALRHAASARRGVVVATAHTGNWDLTACAAARWLDRGEAGLPGSLLVVTKRLSWRALDRYWQSLRAARGVVLVDPLGAAARVREALGRGGTVALMMDQAPERARAVAFHPFLGRLARHDLAPAMMAARHRAPIVVLLGRRLPDGRHRLELGGAIEPGDLRGKGAISSATGRAAEAIERFVRANPEQWLWLHRRWK